MPLSEPVAFASGVDFLPVYSADLAVDSGIGLGVDFDTDLMLFLMSFWYCF